MSDQQAIGAVVHLYVDGMAFGNEAALKKAFHPDARIIGHVQGRMEWLSRDDFVAAVLAEPPASPGSQPLMDIEITDVEGDAAFVKVADEFAGMRFTDYLSLLKIDGRWMIVNKLFHLHR